MIMKRTVLTMLAGLACMTVAFAQTSEERIPAKGFARHISSPRVYPQGCR